MEFVRLRGDMRELLLQAIEIDMKNMKCQYCEESTDHKTCSIMPPIQTRKKATILCESPMCLSWYIQNCGEKVE